MGYVMNYQQTYDPMRYRSRLGEGIAAIGHKALGVVSNYFNDSAAFKNAQSQNSADLDEKKSFIDATIKTLKNKGIDPSEVPGLQNIDVSNPNIDITKLKNMIATEIIPVYEKLKDTNYQNDAQSQLDTMGQGITSSMALPADPSFVGPVQPPTGDPVPEGSPEVTPGTTLDYMQEYKNSRTKSAMEAMKQLDSEVASGFMSREKAIELKHAETKDLDKMILKEQDRIRDEQKSKDDRWESNVARSIGKNRFSSPGGEDVSTVTKDNIGSLGIGEVLPDGSAQGGGRGNGSGNREKPTASWDQYNKIQGQLARLRSGKDEYGSPLIFSTDKDENATLIANEYSAKMNEAGQSLLSHYLEVSGLPYDDAQQRAMSVIDTDLKMDMANRNSPILIGTNATTGGNTFEALNLANPQTIKALILAAKEGRTARDVLMVLKRSKGLNPAKK